jgi:DNA adenine methylase
MAVSNKVTRYIEPFVGGGAFFFYLKNNYDIFDAIIIDINNDLIMAYKVIQKYPDKLIQKLTILENNYLALNEMGRKEFFYDIREKYNINKESRNNEIIDDICILHTAQLIFLNKTCFNGLYITNKKGGI